MSLPERLARTLAFFGLLLTASGILLPVFADFPGFNGFECALYFLNAGETARFSVFLALCFSGSVAGLFFVLRGAGRLAPVLASCLVCFSGALALRLSSALALSAYGWAAAAGLVFQALGCGALVSLKLRSIKRRSI